VTSKQEPLRVLEEETPTREDQPFLRSQANAAKALASTSSSSAVQRHNAASGFGFCGGCSVL